MRRRNRPKRPDPRLLVSNRMTRLSGRVFRSRTNGFLAPIRAESPCVRGLGQSKPIAWHRNTRQPENRQIRHLPQVKQAQAAKQARTANGAPHGAWRWQSPLRTGLFFIPTRTARKPGAHRRNPASNLSPDAISPPRQRNRTLGLFPKGQCQHHPPDKGREKRGRGQITAGMYRPTPASKPPGTIRL